MLSENKLRDLHNDLQMNATITKYLHKEHFSESTPVLQRLFLLFRDNEWELNLGMSMAKKYTTESSIDALD